ncbi:MAG TPA: hypothetical protein VFH68_21075 [Polyangia bacterium]|jgi:hypothetical protein|nr:hypothetical protein [Polyangia bacterium]
MADAGLPNSSAAKRARIIAEQASREAANGTGLRMVRRKKSRQGWTSYPSVQRTAEPQAAAAPEPAGDASTAGDD